MSGGADVNFWLILLRVIVVFLVIIVVPVLAFFGVKDLVDALKLHRKGRQLDNDD